jgi:hypothetical protein
MTLHTTLLGAALGLLLAGEAPAGTSRPPQAAESPKVPQPSPTPQARLYTNEDLDRIHPYAGQTGGGSSPASAAAADPEADPDPLGGAARGESYWRAEAARVRVQVRTLEERAARLRSRIAEREERIRREQQNEVFGRRTRGAGSKPAGDSSSLRASLTAVERQIRRIEDDLEERARRDSALPGWLR